MKSAPTYKEKKNEFCAPPSYFLKKIRKNAPLFSKKKKQLRPPNVLKKKTELNAPLPKKKKKQVCDHLF